MLKAEAWLHKNNGAVRFALVLGSFPAGQKSSVPSSEVGETEAQPQAIKGESSDSWR
jgi:hypothetical protein